MKKEMAILCVLIVGLFSLIMMIYKKTNNVDGIKYKLNQSSDITIMVYDEESNSYLKQENIPIGNYQLNEENTYCINGSNVVEYNNLLGQVKYTFVAVDQCYVYFDFLAIEITIEDSVLTWSEYSGATSYNVYSNDNLLTNTSNTSVELWSLYTEAGTYNVQVEALNSDGSSFGRSESLSYSISKLSPLENIVHSDGAEFRDDGSSNSGEWDTGIEVPSYEYDSVVYANIKQAALDGLLWDGYCGLIIDWQNTFDANFCSEYPQYCIETEMLNNIKFYPRVEACGESRWDPDTDIKIVNNTLRFDYDVTHCQYHNYAFKFRKKGYVDSAWYVGTIDLTVW